MNILINASNLKKGGGLQVADSVCCCLQHYLQHNFVVVLSGSLEKTIDKIEFFSNATIIRYNLPKKIRTILTGHDSFLDRLVRERKIDVVLTIFGPSLWIPKVLHISGFARAQCLLLDSPYYKIMDRKIFIKSYIQQKVWMWAFKRCADIYFTENEFISIRLQNVLKKQKVYTITNYYNQIYDDKEAWTRNVILPSFDGITLLTISANYPHKNLPIIVPTARYLHIKYPNFKFRFILTITKEQLGIEIGDIEQDIIFLGGVSLNDCPYLYEQSDIVFSPTLMECFSAVYPEAMRMHKPIITTDLDVSRSLCGEAALYYDALSPEAFGEAIYQLAHDEVLRNDLIAKGDLQLKTYDNYEERTRKLIQIVEEEYEKYINK